MSRRIKLFFGALVCVLLLMAAIPALASAPQPQPPPGFQGAQPVGLTIHSELLNLTPSACAKVKANLHQTGNAGCQFTHRWWGANHLPLPAGTRLTGGLFSDHVALAYGPYYFTWTDQICAASCSIGAFTQTEDGIYDGASVHKWNHGCTPSGFNTSVTWCGDLYNGGGYPYYAMQFGLNGQVCISVQWGLACYGHGMRRWITDNGWGGDFSWW